MISLNIKIRENEENVRNDAGKGGKVSGAGAALLGARIAGAAGGIATIFLVVFFARRMATSFGAALLGVVL